MHSVNGLVVRLAKRRSGDKSSFLLYAPQPVRTTFSSRNMPGNFESNIYKLGKVFFLFFKFIGNLMKSVKTVICLCFLSKILTFFATPKYVKKEINKPK